MSGCGVGGEGRCSVASDDGGGVAGDDGCATVDDGVAVGLDGLLGDDGGADGRGGEGSGQDGGLGLEDGWGSGVAGHHWGASVDHAVAVGLNGRLADDGGAGLDSWGHSESWGLEEAGLGSGDGHEGEQSDL